MLNDAVLSLSFNSDGSCFTVGTQSGFLVFAALDLELILRRELGGGIALVEILGQSNIFSLVGGGHSPKFPPNKAYL